MGRWRVWSQNNLRLNWSSWGRVWFDEVLFELHNRPNSLRQKLHAPGYYAQHCRMQSHMGRNVGQRIFWRFSQYPRRSVDISLVGDIRFYFHTFKKKHRGEQAKEVKTYPWEEIYEIIVGQFNMPPSEWRDMTPSEGMRLMDSIRPKNVGKLREADFDRCEERREELEAEGITVG